MAGSHGAFGGVLTLPGIAGIVLTIGMTIDANVLVYERIREELKEGHTQAQAVLLGFDRAAVAIADSNTTLVTAGILYRFGTGPVRGFAVTHSLGIMRPVHGCFRLPHYLRVLDPPLRHDSLPSLNASPATDCRWAPPHGSSPRQHRRCHRGRPVHRCRRSHGHGHRHCATRPLFWLRRRRSSVDTLAYQLPLSSKTTKHSFFQKAMPYFSTLLI